MKNYTRIALTALVCMAAWACSEPDKIVSSSTEDGQFRLSLEAEENWIRPSGELPVVLRIERIGGPPLEDFFGEVELVTNGGESRHHLWMWKWQRPSWAWVVRIRL